MGVGLGRIAAAVAVALVLSLAPRASAHGRFPATGQILFHPSDPDTVVVRGTFGVLVSKDGGDTWRWICVQAVGQRMTEDPDLELMEDGSILAAMFDGMARGTDTGCDWSFPSDELEGTVVIDQARHPTDGSTSLAVTSSGGADNLVHRTDDDGATWTPTGDPIDPILFETIAIAPSDPDVVYLTGAYPPADPEPRRPFVYRSDDGAATWESFAWSGGFDDPVDRNIYLAGVDPTDAMRLFVHVRSEEADRLMRSEDGGETWVEVATLAQMNGFAISADGATAWLGGNEGTGLWRSDDGGESFEQIRDDLDVGCLAVRDGELWACGNNFSDGFAVGVSTDGGMEFEPRLVFSEIAGIVECPEGSTTPATCEPHLADLEADLGIGVDGGVPGADAGTAPGGDDAGCSCRAAGTPRRRPAAAILALLGSLIALRRRRGGLG